MKRVILALAVLLLATPAYADRDSAGDYTAPSNSFNPAVTGEPIDPASWNEILGNMEDALSESVYTDGTSSTDNCLIRSDGTNGRKVQTSGVCISDTDVISGVAGITLDTGTAIRTGTTASDTVLLQAYDNDSGPAYVTFGTLTAGNTPSFELDNTTLDTAIAKGTWTASGTWTLPAFTAGGTITWNGQSASGTLANAGTITTADINGGTIDGAVIGGASAAAGSFTTLSATGTLSLPNSGAINWGSGDCTLTEGSDTLTLAGTCVLVTESAGLQVGSSVPFSDSTGTLTLQNVDALDATTESTVESAIDTLGNLTSVQSRTITLSDAGADSFFGWDDTASAYENLTAAEATAILDAFVGDSGAGGTKGLVPAPASGDSSKFLAGDGTWTSIPGGGDMLSTNNLSDVANAATAYGNISVPPTVQMFTSSGTWNKPSGLKVAVIEVHGAGGAGGGQTSSRGGSGGGSGGYCTERIVAASLGSTETVTIGAGGTGSANSDGTGGGSSSFGSHCSATGGTGGAAGGLLPGAGGTGSGGDINATGNDGDRGSWSNPSGGNGGAGFLMGGGAGRGGSSNGSSGSLGGGGGGGGNTAGSVGGPGGAGWVRVTEYY